MRNKVCKSKATSNTHQTVPLAHPVFAETLDFLGSLHTVYGRKRPVKYFACCNTFGVWKGTRGYVWHASPPLHIEAFLGKSDAVDLAKTTQILALEGLADTDRVCVPGFDLECTTYLTLSNFKSTLPSCNPKQDGHGKLHHHGVPQRGLVPQPLPPPGPASD